MMNPSLLKTSTGNCFRGNDGPNNANPGNVVTNGTGNTNSNNNNNNNNNNGTTNGPNNGNGSNGGEVVVNNGNTNNGNNNTTNSAGNSNNNGANNGPNNTNGNNGANNHNPNTANALNSPVRTFSPPSPYTASMFHRDMRRHCHNSMNGTNNPHHVTNTTNLFTAAGLDVSVAELHDLTSRNQGNLKPDMSTMYHHHMMQSRQPHSADMHDFLTSDPMTASLPAALGLAASASAENATGNHHHTVSSVGNQLHAPSSIYSSHHHGAMNMNGMISSLHHHHSSAGSQLSSHQIQNPFHPHHPNSFVSATAASSPHHQLSGVGDPTLIEADPRELEVFAERFKQRRIKLGVTQADVGKALANLKLPGVGSLSQSTICRFESLTLSHNNMVALKPILQAWLEAAEAQARKNRIARETTLDICVLPSLDKKRKRTSIAAPEKRSLEAYFSVQPRPSGEKIAAIAEKLDLKKNVVRVWFCNQRQKQKRMKYSAVNGPGGQGQ